MLEIMGKRGAPKKPPGKGKSASKLVRMSADELQAFSAAADLAGLPASSWMRERLRIVARTELEAAGKVVPFLSDPKK